MKTHALIQNQTNLTGNLINQIDDELKPLLMEIKQSSDPDSHGLLDYSEQICGLGFVVLQTYMVSVCSLMRYKKKEVLSYKPMYKNEISYAMAINAAANYWKHHNEWLIEGVKQNRYVVSAFEKLELSVEDDYPLGNILWLLCREKEISFGKLHENLRKWSKEITKTA